MPRARRASAGSLSFGDRSLAVGMAITTVDAGRVVARMRMRARRSTLEISAEQTRRDELLEVRNGIPRSIRATYGQSRTQTWTRDDGTEDEVGAVQGNTYTVDRAGGLVQGQRQDGRALSEDEHDELVEDFGSLGPEHAVHRTLRGRTVAFGETIDVEVAEHTGLLGPSGTLTMTLVDVRARDGREIAVFDSMTQGTYLGADFELPGRMLVDVGSGWLLSSIAEGPFELEFGPARVKGTMALETTFEYETSRSARSARAARSTRCRRSRARGGCRAHDRSARSGVEYHR
ncbi:MAG: hypothetical protein AAGF11_18765 [Myxococcota bacterium]